ncbi:hypothetical protein ABPG75_012633 [Micractinium tetrahymenae]
MELAFDLLGALPLELSSHCLDQLSCRERHAVVPLVSKRWHELAYSPALLRQLDVELLSTDVLPALRLLSAGLLRRAAGHADSLRLSLDASCTSQPGAPLPEDAATVAVTAAAAADAATEEGVNALTLDGAPLALEEAARLPAGLTKLHLGGVEDPGIIDKVAEATALRSLSLARMEHSAEQLAQLASLGACLQRLAVSWCGHLPAPATLARLRQLQALHIDHTPRRGQAQELCAELQASLEPLTQLTHLVCAHVRAAASMLPALAELGELQSFGWHGPAPTASPALPAGPWMASLRTVAVPAEVAAASLPVLAGATKLEELGLSRFAPSGCAKQYGILRTAAAHPSLRRVCLHLKDAPLAVGWFDAAVEAQRRKPSLRIERSNSIAKTLAGHDVEAA